VNSRIPVSAPAVLLAAGALAAAASGCGSTQASIDPVAQAAEVTTHSGGSQIAMTVTLEGSEFPAALTIKGNGEFNMSRQEGELSFLLDGLPASARAKLPGGKLRISELFKSGDLYLGSPLLAGQLPHGARWMKLDLTKLESDEGIDARQLSSGESDPSQFLQYLRASGGTVKAVGHESLRGAATTRYEGALDLQKEAEQLPATNRSLLESTIKQLIAKTGTSTFPVTVWIDQSHLVRRLKMKIPIAAGSASGSASIDYELFGFGVTPGVNAPAARETFDATKLSAQSLSSSG
jgi:hypothetical protein